MCKLNFFDKLSAVLVLLGAIICGAIGLFTTIVIASLVGNNVIIFRVIYILILIGAIDLISLIFRCDILKN